MATSDLFIRYVRNVRASATSAVVLARRLDVSAPEDLSAVERRALERVQACAKEVRHTQSERDRVAGPHLRVRLDAFIDAWGAMYDALGAVARIPARVSPLGARALALQTSLFPEGVGFVHTRAGYAWSEGSRRIERIGKERMTAELTEVIGHAFLDAVQLATAELADAIGVGENAPAPTPSSTALADALGRFGAAVGAYARLLLAHCDPDDEQSLARVRAAIAPIDQHRARRRSSASSAAPDETPANEAEPAAA